MEIKPGNSSSPAPRRRSGDAGVDALVVFGILVSLVFIGGSALLNFRMGFTSADNVTDGTVYGTLAAAGDGLKALAPFIAAWGWKHRDWLATLAAVTVFVVFTTYSFTSALGFSSQHRAVKEGAAAGAIERHQDVRDQLRRDNARLDALGPQRSSAEVSQAIANQLHMPVGTGRWTVDQVSEGCTKTKAATKDACAKVAVLKEEAVRAEESERLVVEVKSLTHQLDQSFVVQSADPQTDALTFLGHMLHVLPPKDKTETDNSKEAGFGLALLMAVFIELGSGLGLCIATTPWRSRTEEEKTEPPSPALSVTMKGPPLEVFAAERLELRHGHDLDLATVFEAYKEWCELRNWPMQGRGRFERALLRLAKEIGLEVEDRISGWVIRDLSLRGSIHRLAISAAPKTRLAPEMF